MRPNGIKLSRLHQRVLYGSFTALYVSGVAWYVLYAGRVSLLYDNGGLQLPVGPLLLQIHGAAAMLVMLVLGSLMPQHVKWAWKSRMNRSTGGLMLSTQALLVVTGYALYYAGGEELRAFASQLHFLIGVCFPLLLAWHIVEGRRVAAMQKAAAARSRPRPSFASAPLRVDLPSHLASPISSHQSLLDRRS
jgi:hypothetical protein